MLRRSSPRSARTYTVWAIIAAAIGVLDIVVGLGALYAVIMFVLAGWWLLQASRVRASR